MGENLWHIFNDSEDLFNLLFFSQHLIPYRIVLLEVHTQLHFPFPSVQMNSSLVMMETVLRCLRGVMEVQIVRMIQMKRIVDWLSQMLALISFWFPHLQQEILLNCLTLNTLSFNSRWRFPLCKGILLYFISSLYQWRSKLYQICLWPEKGMVQQLPYFSKFEER